LCVWFLADHTVYAVLRSAIGMIILTLSVCDAV